MRFSLLLLPLLFLACSRPIVVHPTNGHETRERRMLEALRATGRPGDWLVIRGYHATDNLVSALTNSPFSHATILDPEREQVVEAEGVGIHTTPLEAFAKKAQRLMIVRPLWTSEPGQPASAVAWACAAVGKKYDYLGLVGLNAPSKCYCSELAVQAYGTRDRLKAHLSPVIPPNELHYYGTIVYDSGAVAE
jgi:hypothetical protein